MLLPRQCTPHLLQLGKLLPTVYLLTCLLVFTTLTVETSPHSTFTLVCPVTALLDVQSLSYHFAGYMLLYLLCVRMLTTSLAHASFSRHLAAAILGCVLFSQALVSGYLIHEDDLPVWVSWIRYGGEWSDTCTQYLSSSGTCRHTSG
jgi:hypothetical protein